MKQHESKQKKIAIYGHFNSTNFGNESTLQAVLYHLRRFYPEAKVICICTYPDTTVATHHVNAIGLSEAFFDSWVPTNGFTRLLRRLCVGLPSEPFRWVRGFIKLRGTEMLIIPGTGLLTDAYGLLSWGPYNLFKWSLIAKACRCKLVFLSVGAGPIYGILGRNFIKFALALADFRSYRDNSTRQYLKGIGFDSDKDRVYPDLVFSLPTQVTSNQRSRKGSRAVVGLGVMEYAGKYSISRPRDAIYLAYLENLVDAVKWLVAHEYDVRLLSGDLGDMQSRQEFKALLRERLSACDEGRIIDEPIYSVQDVWSQIAATDFVVATRFHNIVMSLLCEKPVISISFHHKCASLMDAMSLAQYCLDINNFQADELIEKICDLEINANKIKVLISEKTMAARTALNEQYHFIFNNLLKPDERPFDLVENQEVPIH
jgi:polysaccharide pyruvyl transferase WcaK-like protein